MTTDTYFANGNEVQLFERGAGRPASSNIWEYFFNGPW